MALLQAVVKKTHARRHVFSMSVFQKKNTTSPLAGLDQRRSPQEREQPGERPQRVQRPRPGARVSAAGSHREPEPGFNRQNRCQRKPSLFLIRRGGRRTPPHAAARHQGGLRKGAGDSRKALSGQARLHSGRAPGLGGTGLGAPDQGRKGIYSSNGLSVVEVFFVATIEWTSRDGGGQRVL